MTRFPRILASVSALALLAGLAATSVAQAAPAPTPAQPSQDVWVVSLGDSYISGEAGRWAGNESLTTRDVDALGKSAYWDDGDRETISRCHRSASALIHIGVVKSLNLACSGAITSTKFDAAGDFKPGIDFYRDGDRKGQALMLQEFARDHDVRMVALSIGGNDFRFADVLEICIKAFLAPFGSSTCRDNAKAKSYLDDDSVAKVRANIAGAIIRVGRAMRRAGKADSEWTLVVQTYPQPLPHAKNMRYGERGYGRQSTGGCGFRDADLDWAADKVLPLINETVQKAAADAVRQRPTMQVSILDTSAAFGGRTLCHEDVWRVQERGFWGNLKGARSWQVPGAVDRSEWVMEVNLINGGQTFQQESLHPNYWGQLALRNCWRQAWNDGSVRGGACERQDSGGLNARGEPHMLLAGARDDYRVG